MAVIFLTGASGYLGGQVLYRLKNSPLSSATISCLNRDSAKASQIQQAYPDVKIVEGGLDDAELIAAEAAKADVILNFASTKHAASTDAIVAGLTSAYRKASKPSTWIQMSGASMFASQEIADKKFGEASDEIHSDVSDIFSILKLIRSSPSRYVDQTVLAQDASMVKTALIVGPLIYGTGQGPCHTRSIQAPEIARVTMELGHGIRLLKGENAWSNVHVADIAELVYLLTEAALTGRDVGWNEEGLYLPENGSLMFGQLDRLIAQEAVKQGFIETEGLREIDAKKADELSPHASLLWGTNALIKSERAGEKLGWHPTGRSLSQEVPDVVKREGQALKGRMPES